MICKLLPHIAFSVLVLSVSETARSEESGPTRKTLGRPDDRTSIHQRRQNVPSRPQQQAPLSDQLLIVFNVLDYARADQQIRGTRQIMKVLARQRNEAMPEF